MHPSFTTVVVGAGNAGVSLAARMRRDGHGSIALIEPNRVHRYRPMLNYIATSRAPVHAYERRTKSVVPSGVDLVEGSVVEVHPDDRQVVLDSGELVGYERLVLCPGLEPDWHAVPGLEDAYAAGLAVSAHVPPNVGATRTALDSVREGTVVFSVPPEPGSCVGTVIKALLIACDTWRRAGLLRRLRVHLVTPYTPILGLHPADERLAPYLETHGITVHTDSVVTAVSTADRTVSITSPNGSSTLRDVTLAYVTPHSRAPRFIAASGLADRSAAELVEIDPQTLRHRRFPEVWGLGDAAAIATRSSGGALRRQVSVLADNIAAEQRGSPMRAYDGYTIVPIAVSRTKLLLAEHTRDGIPSPTTTLIDLTKPRRMLYVFDRYIEPRVYYQWLLEGRV